MAKYLFNCHKCTNKAHGGTFDADYCLPMVKRGKWPGVFHDEGKTSKDYFTCPDYTTDKRTIAIYEMVVNQ